MSGETYEVFAVRYGYMDRRASENFLGGCACDGPMPIDYFVWVVRSAARTVVVDTGFGPAEGVRRGRSVLNSVGTGLAVLGVDPARVDDVLLTHLHYEHAGNLGLFPRARFHLQERELQFVVGRYMADPTTASAYAAEEIVDAVRLVHAGRVRFPAEDEELFPGLSVHLVGGHTGGTQVVRVATARVRSCWPPTPCTSTPTWRGDMSSPSRTIRTTSSRCTTGASPRSSTTRPTSSRVTIRSSWPGTPRRARISKGTSRC